MNNVHTLNMKKPKNGSTQPMTGSADLCKFETFEMGVARVARKCDRRLQNENLDDRTRMEVEFLKEALVGDPAKAEKIGANLEKMSTCKIRVINGSKP